MGSFRLGGNLNNGANGGRRYENLNNGLGGANWNNASRLSDSICDHVTCFAPPEGASKELGRSARN